MNLEDLKVLNRALRHEEPDVITVVCLCRDLLKRKATTVIWKPLVEAIALGDEYAILYAIHVMRSNLRTIPVNCNWDSRAWLLYEDKKEKE